MNSLLDHQRKLLEKCGLSVDEMSQAYSLPHPRTHAHGWYGYEEVRRFYGQYFNPGRSSEFEVTRISRTWDPCSLKAHF
jgi:hypothetical protein